MKIIFIGLLINLSTLGFSQILDHSKGELFSEDPEFNQTFILDNKIKSIKGFYSTKSNLDRIRPNSNVYVYEFNTLGQLVKDYKTIFNDTIIRYYEYDARNNLLSIRKTDNYGYYSYQFKYDSLDRVIEKEYRRDLNKTYSKLNFDLDKSFSISKQKYSYEMTKLGLKKYYYNTTGKVFRIEFFYQDENGYLLKQESNAIKGSTIGKVEYEYNEQGLLKERITTSLLATHNVSKIKYDYDANENILAQHYYRKGKYRTEYQIVYDSRTMLLSALLERDIETNIITILKFSDYTYFD